MTTPTAGTEPAVLWSPADDAWEATRIGAFARVVAERHGVAMGDYDALWRWSVDQPDAFWREVVDHFGVRFHEQPSQIRRGERMPNVSWCLDATLNYAEHALRNTDGDQAAIIARSQTRDAQHWTYDDLRDAVARAAAGLRRLGVGHGDRVAAYLPNVPETIVAFLATASVGAIWSSCAPEFGVTSVIDRLEQIAPKVLLVIDGYRYGDRPIDRTDQVAAIRDALPTLEHTVVLHYLDATADVPDAIDWDALVAEPAELAFTPVDFDHPLYILFSSGTTGIPKAIVHGHGGITLEHLKILGLHHDLGPGDRFFWFTTTGWMMWNFLVSGLLMGSTLVLFDGDPGHPDLTALWRLAEETGITVFGVSAPFLMGCRKQELTPGADHDLSPLRQIGSTGAPLPSEGFQWCAEHVGSRVQVASVSGGTDMCTAFVGASPVTPVWAGEISCRCLGARVEAYDPDGRPVIGTRGELVITAPMPSMPVGFWGDDDGSRYHDAYFDVYPGVWRHGDWIRITERGSCVITGRSDATKTCPTWPTRSSSTSRTTRAEQARCCCSSSPPRAASSTTSCAGPSAVGFAANCHRATCPTSCTPCPPYRARCRARSWRCRSNGCSAAPNCATWPVRARWPTPSRWPPTSGWPDNPAEVAYGSARHDARPWRTTRS
jgi:acetoacetyl-CoA synthetase